MELRPETCLATMPLKYWVDPMRPITYGIVQCGPDFADGVPYIRPVDMSEEGGVANPEALLRTDPEIASSYRRSTVHANDLVISIGPSFGKVMVVSKMLDGVNLTQGTARVAPRPEHEARFIFWALRSSFCGQQWKARVSGATFAALNLGPLGETLLPVPNSAEQRSIALFLDRETAKIDALVEKKRDLVEKLKEKRTALISHAVTRGLDPNATLKPSGVEWLGDVPEHWEVKRTKRVFTERHELSDSGEEELLTVSHITGVTKRSEKDVTMFEAESNEGYKICSPGNLVINTLWAWMGAMGISPEEGIVSPAYHVYELSDEISPGYVGALVRTPVFIHEVTRFSTGIWSSRLRLYPEALFEVRVPVPPLGEQQAIASFLDRETAKIDALVAKVETAIEKLQEYRTALITAAVTGKIDVRKAAA
jgi:type I restriction enzyme S subunit